MAFQLGVTLETIYNMSSKEYMGWIKYFNERPYGWRQDHRAAILAQTTYQGTKPLNVSELFPSLQVMRNSNKQKDLKLEAGFNKLKSLAKKSK
jgi:hypothetical protein